MFKELFRFKGELTLESVKAGAKEQTGEKDLLGFEDDEFGKTEQELFDESVREGFIEEDNEYIVINADM